jgi:hypothetical protein
MTDDSTTPVPSRPPVRSLVEVVAENRPREADQNLVLPPRLRGQSVEVAGIEPASSVASTGLLRAQCASPLLGPTGHAHEPVRRAQSL